MDNNQQDITADLTDERLQQAAARNYRSRSDSDVPRRVARYRAVAALAREGWRPIRSDALLADEGEVLELAGILDLLQIPNWPGRVLRAAELLVHQADLLAHQQEPASVPALSPRPPVTAIAPAPVLASERPWERDGWCDEQGQCWMGDPAIHDYKPVWKLCRPEDCSFSRSLPHWAIPVPALGDAS